MCLLSVCGASIVRFPVSFVFHSPSFPFLEFRFLCDETSWLRCSAVSADSDSEMLSWGEQSARGFRLKDGTSVSDGGDGVTLLDLPGVTELCVGQRLLSYVRGDGIAFIIRCNRSRDGTWARGRQSECRRFSKTETNSAGYRLWVKLRWVEITRIQRN